jgi:pimeloyl-ACP methyl ester carboxylesterase
MTANDLVPEDSQPATRLFGGLAGDLDGEPDHRPPLVLLHGLTFDRTMWGPALGALSTIDRGRQTLALDLPGHGQSPGWPRYDLDSLVHGVHRAVEESRLRSPILVGHSYSAIVASVYAATFPARGVVNVDQWLRVQPIAELAQALAAQLRGPGFKAAWQMFEDSMHAELLPAAAQQLIRSTCDPRQELVTGYWRELLDTPAAETAAHAEAGISALRASGTPYLFIAGHELEPEYETWLREKLPQVRIAVWPGSGHFPHLAHPDWFAECLAAAPSWKTA